jgi:hypothetical protein
MTSLGDMVTNLCANVSVQRAGKMIGIVHHGNLRHDGQHAKSSSASDTNHRRF